MHQLAIILWHRNPESCITFNKCRFCLSPSRKSKMKMWCWMIFNKPMKGQVGCHCWPMHLAQVLWAGRNLYRATPSLFLRSHPYDHPKRLTFTISKGYWDPILTRISQWHGIFGNSGLIYLVDFYFKTRYKGLT